jgi:putative transposase
VILKAYQYRLDLSSTQTSLFRQWAGCARWTYNAALAASEAAYKTTGKGLGTSALCGLLTTWRAEHDWLKLFPAQSAQQAIRDLGDGFRRFFKKQNKRPTFKRKGRCRDSFRFPNQKSGKGRMIRLETLNRTKARLKLPKVGWVKLRYSRTIDGEIRSVTVFRDGARWFVSILLRTDEKTPEAPEIEDVRPERMLGFDLGVVNTATFTDPKREPFDVPALSEGDERHMRRLQKRMARRQGPRPGKPPSKNWMKARDALQKCHAKLRRRRLDAIHKLTAVLTNGKQYDAIVMEDLNTKEMTKQKRGKGRRAKAKLNRAILSQSWGEIRRQLTYKCQRAGIVFRVVDPAYTSQKCSNCGHTERDNRKTQARFLCLRCGHTENADENAAKNILAAGHGRDGLPRGCKTDRAGGNAGEDRSPCSTPARNRNLGRMNRFVCSNSRNPRPSGRGGCQTMIIDHGACP